MANVISLRGGKSEPTASGYVPGKSFARGFTILTHSGGVAAREADAAAMRSTWHTVWRSLTDLGGYRSDEERLRGKFDEFCDGAAAARLRSARLALAVSSAGATIASLSAVSVAVLAFGDDRLGVLFAYLATCSVLSLPLLWAMKRRSPSTMIVSVLTVVAAGWWATGAAYPPEPRSTLDILLGDGEDTAVGIALGAVLVGVLILVASLFATVGALIRRDQNRFRRPDLKAFDELLQIIVPLAEAAPGHPLDHARRHAIADSLASARRAVSRIPAATRRYGSRRDRRVLRRGLRRWARRFRASTGILWSTPECVSETLRICLESMVPLLTGYYGNLGRVAKAATPDVVQQSPWSAKWLRRLSGAAVPPSVLVAAHVGGIPASSTVGVAIAFVAASTLLLVVAGANDSRPLAVLSDLLHVVRKHGQQRFEKKSAPELARTDQDGPDRREQ
jgi:hypothetical protein